MPLAPVFLLSPQVGMRVKEWARWTRQPWLVVKKVCHLVYLVIAETAVAAPKVAADSWLLEG